MKVLSVEQMREYDRISIKDLGIPGPVLMENAGRGCTEAALELLAGSTAGAVTIFCGAGNNGGDGYVVARYLLDTGFDVEVYSTVPEKKITGDARAHFDLAKKIGVPVTFINDEEEIDGYFNRWSRSSLIVDALLGTGLSGEVRGIYKPLIEAINELGCPVLSVDIPSGLDADTGQPLGLAVRATVTATFAYPKVGQLQYPGPAYCGDLHVVDIGIPRMIEKRVVPVGVLLQEEEIRSLWPSREQHSHKGNFGHIVTVSGSTGYPGAGLLCSAGAMRMGAGLSTLLAPGPVARGLYGALPELMVRPMTGPDEDNFTADHANALLDFIKDKSVVAVGPGLGSGNGQTELMEVLLQKIELPIIVDADGLNAISENPGVLKKRKAPTVITPHPGEFGRLIGKSAAEVQAARFELARAFAEEFDVIVLLKGAASLVAAPQKQTAINPTGNPGMASGGMGDVLTGMVAALIGQGLEPYNAACLAVYAHGAAADKAAGEKGYAALMAGDVIEQLPKLLKSWGV